MNSEISAIEVEAEKTMVSRVSLQEQIKGLRAKEAELTRLNKEDEQLVNESRARVEAAKAEVEREKGECRKRREESDSFAIQLDQRRSDFSRIVASYDFLKELDEIENLFADGRKDHSIDDVSLLDHSVLNTSGISDNPKIKQFPAELLYKNEPTGDYS